MNKNMKARFSCSDMWNMSVLRQGRLQRLTDGKVRRKWKVCYAILRDDTSFRWYKDPECLERKGEVWLEEVATEIVVGRRAYEAVLSLKDKPMVIIQPHKVTCKTGEIDPDLCLTIPDPDTPGRKLFFFCFECEADFNCWISVMAKSLDDKKIRLPKSALPANSKSNLDLQRERLSEKKRHISDSEVPSDWELFWFIYAPTANGSHQDDVPSTTPLQQVPDSNVDQANSDFQGSTTSPTYPPNYYGEGAAYNIQAPLADTESLKDDDVFPANDCKFPNEIEQKAC